MVASALESLGRIQGIELVGEREVVCDCSRRKEKKGGGTGAGQKAGGAGLERCDIVNRSRETVELDREHGAVEDRARPNWSLKKKPVGNDAR